MSWKELLQAQFYRKSVLKFPFGGWGVGRNRAMAILNIFEMQAAKVWSLYQWYE